MADRRMKVVLIGAGNVATHIGRAIADAGHSVVQVWSRTSCSADRLARLLGCESVTALEDLTHDADLYVVSVSDDALDDVVGKVCRQREDRLFVHTAGSLSMEVFKGRCRRYGIFYPLQTFSKEKPLDFREIPLFVEASDERTLGEVETLARQLSRQVYRMSSEARRRLHLSAVFACNFANHCYAIAEELLQEVGIPFEALLPLIDETARKVHALPPRQAQTGPAVRRDRHVMARQHELLAGHPRYADIYDLMSQSIMQSAVAPPPSSHPSDPKPHKQ